MLYRNLLDMLFDREQRYPDKKAFVYLLNGEVESESLTYGELGQSAKKVAAYLQFLELKGERVLILLPSGIDYLVVFLGCLCAGVIPIPVYPPTKSRNTDRLLSIYENAEPSLIILPSTGMLTKLSATMHNTPTLLIEELLEHDFTYEPQIENISPNDIAFLQFTSGSTSNPKGVMVTHQNLLHNFNLMASKFEHSVQTRMVTWLPFYHDMGLIGNLLQNIYNGSVCYIMSPLDFIQKPIRWLRAISKYAITYSGGPDFSYRLCSQKITEEEKQGLDLGSWSNAYCGSEPIYAETLRMFNDSFKNCGFKEKALLPGYGLAEFTLCATVTRRETGPIVQEVDREALSRNQIIHVTASPEPGVTLVSSGALSDFLNVEIVDPNALVRCQEREVGEIWLHGDSVATGYWNDPIKSREIFQATLADQEDQFFLRTGDLGFVDQGELYVTGRLKDLIIIRGQNYYPQDIEFDAASCHEDINETSLAAFSINHQGNEELVVVCEMKREFKHKAKQLKRELSEMIDEVVSSIRVRILEKFQIHAYDVQIVHPLGIPKTSSNKVQRSKCKEMYLDGTLHIWGEAIERSLHVEL